MSHFTTPVTAYARGPLISVHPDTPVAAVLDLLEERSISAVPVLDSARRALGVISRTDLLRLGTPRPKADTLMRRTLVELPEKRAGDVMRPGVLSVPRTTPVAAASKLMVVERKHRLFVTDHEDHVVEVFGTREVMMAIWEARVETPIGSIMTRKPFTIPHDAPVSLATERLEQAHAQGVVVIDPEAWPIGLFTQREALEARGLEPETPVEHAMSYGMLCLHTSTPLYRAAAQAAHTRARRVLCVEDAKVVGVVTGLDFARLARGV